MDTPDQEEEQVNEAYDKNLDFVFVVQPFQQNFARVEYPFYEDSFNSNLLSDLKRMGTSERVIFINSKYLVVAQGNQLKYMKLSDLSFDQH